MLLTNLLPPEEKKMLHLEQSRRMIQFFCFTTTAVLSMGLVFLLPSYFNLWFQIKNSARALQSKQEAARELEAQKTLERVQRFQAVLASVQAFAHGGAGFAEPIEYFFRTAETYGALVTSITLKRDGSINVAGVGATRRGLLDFEKALRASNRLQNISFPLSNIIEERNAHFTLQARLRPEYGLAPVP